MWRPLSPPSLPLAAQSMLATDQFQLGYCDGGHCHGVPNTDLSPPQRLVWDIPEEVGPGPFTPSGVTAACGDLWLCAHRTFQVLVQEVGPEAPQASGLNAWVRHAAVARHGGRVRFG